MSVLQFEARWIRQRVQGRPLDGSLRSHCSREFAGLHPWTRWLAVAATGGWPIDLVDAELRRRGYATRLIGDGGTRVLMIGESEGRRESLLELLEQLPVTAQDESVRQQPAAASKGLA